MHKTQIARDREQVLSNDLYFEASNGHYFLNATENKGISMKREFDQLNSIANLPFLHKTSFVIFLSSNIWERYIVKCKLKD